MTPIHETEVHVDPEDNQTRKREECCCAEGGIARGIAGGYHTAYEVEKSEGNVETKLAEFERKCFSELWRKLESVEDVEQHRQNESRHRDKLNPPTGVFMPLGHRGTDKYHQTEDHFDDL